MGEAELKTTSRQLCIHSVIFFYGDAASDALSIAIARDIADHWNEAKGKATIKNLVYNVVFDIEGIWARSLTPEMVFENTNPRNNYFRVEEFASGNISFVDGAGSNTGYFKLDNLLNNSTTQRMNTAIPLVWNIRKCWTSVAKERLALCTQEVLLLTRSFNTAR